MATPPDYHQTHAKVKANAKVSNRFRMENERKYEFRSCARVLSSSAFSRWSVLCSSHRYQCIGVYVPLKYGRCVSYYTVHGGRCQGSSQQSYKTLSVFG